MLYTLDCQCAGHGTAAAHQHCKKKEFPTCTGAHAVGAAEVGQGQVGHDSLERGALRVFLLVLVGRVGSSQGGPYTTL